MELVDVDKVIGEIITHFNMDDDRVIHLIKDIKALKQGNTYIKCLNCGNQIYFDEKTSLYRHVVSGDIHCNKRDEYIMAKQIAIPYPSLCETE